MDTSTVTALVPETTSSSLIASVNPATGELLRSYEELTDSELEGKIGRAAETFASYRKMPFAQRAVMMNRAAEILESERGNFARLMTLEMGKTYKSAVAEAAKCATACRYYAENAERLLADEVIQTGDRRSFVRYLPIGPVLAVMP